MSGYMRGDQKTGSTMFLLGIKPRSLGFVVSPFTYSHLTSPALHFVAENPPVAYHLTCGQTSGVFQAPETCD